MWQWLSFSAIRFISSPWAPALLLAPDPRPSCSDHVHGISGNLNQIA